MIQANLDVLVACLYEAGVSKWAVSPGSRNAPIIAAMLRHGNFELSSFPDERCAAYAALGMSLASQYTTGVICTSGTAVLNLYPGICEAYYQRVPIIALTADRPENLIDQWDGQTIRQNEIFNKHILQSYETPQDLHAKDYTIAIQDIIFNSVFDSLNPVKGPVHINIPLKDPIYSGISTSHTIPKIPSFVFKRNPKQELDLAFLHSELSKYKKILVVGGQNYHSHAIQRSFANISRFIPIVADITSNQSQNTLPFWEMGLASADDKHLLQPDLLITFGLSVTSKDLKQFLRTHKPKQHWHISEGGFTGDPFQTDPETKFIQPSEFFDNMAALEDIGDFEYLQCWKTTSHNGKKEFESRIEKQDSTAIELGIVQKILENCDHSVALHLGNSMSIRYAGWVGQTEAQVFCNRGTSGIDGTISTAMGYALTNLQQRVICIVGDISFFYDSNGLWTNTFPSNLSIVILNNHGGKIFQTIHGPSEFPPLLPFITTPHSLSAKHIAEMFKLTYANITSVGEEVVSILESGKTNIIEININENE